MCFGKLKNGFLRVRNAQAQIRLRMRAVWSGPAHSATEFHGHGSIEWRESSTRAYVRDILYTEMHYSNLVPETSNYLGTFLTI